jgi:hypothetical protein
MANHINRGNIDGNEALGVEGRAPDQQPESASPVVLVLVLIIVILIVVILVRELSTSFLPHFFVLRSKYAP